MKLNKNKRTLIDCDVHVYPVNADAIKVYLDQPWKHRFGIRKNMLYKNPLKPTDKNPPSGGEAGTDPVFLREQLINQNGIAHAILFPRANVTANHDPDYSTAVASAYNNWLADTWLNKNNDDGVFKGSITISHQDPYAAAKEIDRWAGHPHFVQVLADSGARAPFGQRQYYPIYEACARNGLPLAIHPGSDGMGINQLVSQGYPSHYLEYYTGFSFAMQSHLVSLLTEGVFERFPDFRVVITEGGVTWLPALMWRLDMEYKGLRSEIPSVKRIPSEYLREHVRFTSQPLERPRNDQDLLEVLDMMDAEHLLMFSSDYPDSNFESVEAAFPKMSESMEKRIFFENARDFYKL
ncbi:amidohydrolase family protein [Paenibacillus agricola]|uniref:Amidohydrolase n=1 Tax=Paenibacillus agricola TaxID=2716264 RepID=A0ABX0JI75_9BACL|nr:amidohydrolase family protein [Paenibacillus agricola]NHN34119.1 amidohydrolase [Paenibacillus agricola]